MARGRPKSPKISRRTVLEQALKIIEDEGVGALTIRRLGKDLGVEGVSLYHHFVNKDAILVGACELALAHVRTPKSVRGSWKSFILANAIEMHKAICKYPDLAPLIARRNELGIGLNEYNATIALLSMRGFPPEAILSLIESLEMLALASARYSSLIEHREEAAQWVEEAPILGELSKCDRPSREDLFKMLAEGIIATLEGHFHLEKLDLDSA